MGELSVGELSGHGVKQCWKFSLRSDVEPSERDGGLFTPEPTHPQIFYLHNKTKITPEPIHPRIFYLHNKKKSPLGWFTQPCWFYDWFLNDRLHCDLNAHDLWLTLKLICQLSQLTNIWSDFPSHSHKSRSLKSLKSRGSWMLLQNIFSQKK